MSAFPPNLSDEALGVLRVINNSGLTRGGAIMAKAEIKDPNTLLGLVKQLLNQGLIEVTGELTPDAVPFATFSARPSAQGYIRTLVQRW